MKTPNRLLTVPEIFMRFPGAFFNDLGELIYDRKRNRYILPTKLHKLGTMQTGWANELYYFPLEEYAVGNWWCVSAD